MKLISVSIMDKIPRLVVDSLHYALNLHRGDVIPFTVHAISKSATIFIDVYKASDYLSASSTKRVAPVLTIFQLHIVATHRHDSCQMRHIIMTTIKHYIR